MMTKYFLARIDLPDGFTVFGDDHDWADHIKHGASATVEVACSRKVPSVSPRIQVVPLNLSGLRAIQESLGEPAPFPPLK